MVERAAGRRMSRISGPVFVVSVPIRASNRIHHGGQSVRASCSGRRGECWAMLQGLPLRCCAGKLIGRAMLRWDDPLRFAQMQARKVDLPQPVRYEELQREVMSE